MDFGREKKNNICLDVTVYGPLSIGHVEWRQKEELFDHPATPNSAMSNFSYDQFLQYDYEQ